MHADQSVLAVIAVFIDKHLPGAASLMDFVAVGIVVVTATALDQQAVAFDVGQVGTWLFALAEEVTAGVVGLATLEQVAILLANAVGLQTALFVVNLYPALPAYPSRRWIFRKPTGLGYR